MKVGLLMALCFPTCDIPQLTLLCEAGLWTVIAGMRTVEGSIRMEQGRVWQNLEESLAALEGIDIMKSHKLLQQLRMFFYSLFLTQKLEEVLAASAMTLSSND